ncbi:MAG: hypothetical protein Kow0068_26480 [Marinilabiliales bacterium]
MKLLFLHILTISFCITNAQEYLRILSYKTINKAGNSLLVNSSETTLTLCADKNNVQITGILPENHKLYKKLNLKKNDTLRIVYYQNYQGNESPDKTTNEEGILYKKQKKSAYLIIDTDKFEPEHYKKNTQIGYIYNNYYYQLILPEPVQEIVKPD